VIALHFAKQGMIKSCRLIFINDGIAVFIGASLMTMLIFLENTVIGKWQIGFWQLLFGVARGLTAPAADAACEID
jgi:hypothetical protein